MFVGIATVIADHVEKAALHQADEPTLRAMLKDYLPSRGDSVKEKKILLVESWLRLIKARQRLLALQGKSVLLL